MNFFELFRTGSVNNPVTAEPAGYIFSRDSAENIFSCGRIYNRCFFVCQLKSFVLLFCLIIHRPAVCIYSLIITGCAVISVFFHTENAFLSVKNDHVTVLSERKNDFSSACQELADFFIVGRLPCT